MSLLAGFDLVTEISNETILKLLKKNLQIGGVSVVPTFELTLPISGGGASGTAHLIVKSLDLDLNADDTMTLSLGFEKTSVNVTSPLPLTICPLDGTLAITAAIILVNAGGSNQQVSVNMGSATVAITYSAQADATITQDLAGTPVSPTTFKSLAVQALTSFVQGVPSPTVPMAFSVVPGTDGSLTPSLQFEKLEVHCIPNANRSQQALGLFGILLAANDSHGNHANKTGTAITAAHDGMCISISPQAFNKLVFCPAIATALSTSPSSLPPSCGSNTHFSTQGVTVKSITDSFATGHIDINGAVSKSGTCYDASGTFHGTIIFTASGSTLTPAIHMDQPNVDVSIPWYCWLVAGIVLGPLGLVLAGVLDGVANGIAGSLAGAALSNALGGGIPGVSLGGLSGASFSGVVITTAGLTLQGSVPVFVSAPFLTPEITVAGSVTTGASHIVSSGTFHTQLWCMDHAKDYPYTEYAQNQKGTYNVTGQLVTQPFTPHFSLQVPGGPIQPLSGNSGTAVLSNVECHYPMPLATGGNAVVQDVHIGYFISGTTIQLTNTPSEGDYYFYLNATASDCNGNPLKDFEGDDMLSWAQVQFEGDHVDIGGDYAADEQQCAAELQKLLQQILQNSKQWQYVPTWVQVDFPPPEQLIQYFRDLVSINEAVADEILIQSKIAHGNSFYRAIFSPAATQPNLLRTNQSAVAQSQIAALTSQIASLTEQLAKANAARIATSGQQIER